MNNSTKKKKLQKIRKKLRLNGILPEYGKPLNEQQQKIWNDINEGKQYKDILTNSNPLIKPHRCKNCGDTNANNFYKSKRYKCKSCILKNMKEKHDNGEYDNWYNKNLIRIRVLQAKHRAKRKNLDFELTDNVILDKIKKQNGKCYISHLEMKYNKNDKHSLSIDRLDSNKGYTIDNTILVTQFVNISKNDLSLEQFLKEIEFCYNGMKNH